MHITVCAGYLGLCKRVRFLRGLRIWVGHELIVYSEPPARIDRLALTNGRGLRLLNISHKDKCM